MIDLQQAALADVMKRADRLLPEKQMQIYPATPAGRVAVGLSVNLLNDAMGGRPVWLASLSRLKDSGRIIPTPRWSEPQMRAARKVLYDFVLRGVGDPELERGFRMNATLCIHRSLSDAEIDALPADCRVPPLDLAGGPVEVLWRTPKVKDALSTYPCACPTHQQLPGTRDPDMWFPIDCGKCASCVARAARAKP